MIKKVKIRDLTEEQRQEVCGQYAHCPDCPFYVKTIDHSKTCVKAMDNSVLSAEFLIHEVEIRDPVLTEEEENWFRNLFNGLWRKPDKISFAIDPRNNHNINLIYDIEFIFTFLVKEDWFKGMQPCHSYTLEELGL